MATLETYTEKYKRLRKQALGQEGEEDSSLDDTPPPALLPETNPEGKALRWESVHPKLKTVAEEYSQTFGEPVYTSGYRSQQEQDALQVPGKAKYSRHSEGKALDERIRDLTPDEINERLNFYNSQPGIRASVHGGNHIHVEYLGDDKSESIDYSDPKTQERLSKLGIKPPTDYEPDLKNIGVASKAAPITQKDGIDLPPETAQVLSDAFRERQLKERTQKATPIIPRVEGKERSSEVQKFFDEWLQPQSEATFKDIPVIPPQVSRYLTKIALTGTPIGLLPSKEIREGIEESIAKNISGFTTPKNIAIGAGLSTPLSPYLLAAMTPEMIASTLESGKSGIQNIREGKTKEAAEDITNSLLSAVMTATGGRSAYKGIKGDIGAIRGKVAAPEISTIPEAPATLEAQVKSLSEGKNKAVLITEGEAMPEYPSIFKSVKTDLGTWIYDPMKIKRGQIEQAVENGTYWKILGFKEPKSPETTQAVTATLPDGVEAKTAVVSPEKIEAQAKELKRQFPDAEIEIGGPEKSSDVLERRIQDAAHERFKPEDYLREYLTPREGGIPTKTGSGDLLLEGREVPQEAQGAPLRKQEVGEPVYLGSGLGGLQKIFEKSPEEQARAAKVKTLEEHAKKNNKTLVESMDDLGMEFDPDLYVDAISRQQEIARKGEGVAFGKKASDLYKEIKRKIIDSNAPIEDLLSESQKKYKYEVLPKYDISNNVDRVYRAPTLASQFAQDFGLEKVIKDAPDLNKLDQYLIAKQAKTVTSKGIETGRDLIKDQALIDSLGKEYEPYAKAVNQYSRDLLNYSVDAGLISKDLAAQLKETYPDYVPLNRVFTELEKEGQASGHSKAVASVSKQSVVQKLKGSEREIESPVASLLGKTYDAFLQGEKNKAAAILSSYRELPGFEGVIRELKPGEKAQHKISFLDNGIKREFEVPKEIEAAAKALDVQQLELLGKIFATPVRLAKLGITGVNLPFTLANVTRDQLTALVNGRTLLNPIIYTKALFKALKESVTHGPLYKEMVREAAGGTSFDIARNQPIETISEIRSHRGIGARAKYIARHPSELLKIVEDVIGRSEEVTRLHQYEGMKQYLLKQGRTLEDAKILAAKAARENTANFYRRGEWGKVLNSSLLYFNAAKEGSRAFIRSFRKNPIQTAAKVATVVYFPTALVTAWNLSDPKRKKAYDDILEYEKKGNFIIVPPNPTQDEKGRWNVIKIPMEPGIGKLAIPLRRYIEQLNGLDPVQMKEVAQAMVGAISPIDPELNQVISTVTPQAIKPTIEAYANYDFFREKPIVPRKLQDLPPELQVKPTTSGTARKIGGLLGVSPMKVENFVYGTGGGVGGQLLNAVDQALAATGKIPKEQVGGQSIPSGIISRFTKARGGKVEEREMEAIQPYVQGQKKESALLKDEARNWIEGAKGLSDQELDKKLSELESNPKLYERVVKALKDQESAFTPSDYLVKQLNSTQRAKYILDSLDTFKSQEQKDKFIDELVQKKLLTDKVGQEMISILKQSKKGETL